MRRKQQYIWKLKHLPCMWLTLNMIIGYAFINLIQKHHLYNKDQNNFCIFFILNQVVSRYHTAGRANTLHHSSPPLRVPFRFVSSPSWCLTGQGDFSLRGSWLCISELCLTPWLHFVNCAILTSMEGQAQHTPCWKLTWNGLMAGCFFPIPYSDIFLVFLSLLVHIYSDLLIPYFFSHGLFCLLGWLMSCVLLFLTADLGSFLVLLYHFTGASSAFGYGLSVTALNHLVLV